MQPTTYPHINELLNLLLARMQTALGNKLVGLYLYGSLVAGDYDDGTSDMDLFAAISSDLDETEFQALHKMHDDFVSEHQQWEHRLEIAYLSLDGLKTFKQRASQIAVISPGEPFHFKEAGIDWLPNWYVVREKGVTLFGPPPETIIDPISKDEFVQAVRGHMLAWREWIKDVRTLPSQAYAILTMCRGLYTCKQGEQVSKRQAALWAAEDLPAWSSLIKNALVWRLAWRDSEVDSEATLPETRRFVAFMIDQALGLQNGS